MLMKITGSWELSGLTLSQQFMHYADSYLEASRTQCLAIHNADAKFNWQNAVVAMMLAAHSAELFLKSAILSISPGQRLPGHDLRELTDLYNTLSAGNLPQFDNPFETELPQLEASAVEDLRKLETPQSILYRYPADRYGIEWPGAYAFDSLGFLQIIDRLNEQFTLIKGRI
jgi:hypothetical protein